MIKVSIVVAAFNVEQYIREAIGSLLAQTLREIEIVIVDDCSTDGTPAILAQLAATDERIKVIRHETNKSAMQVRKTGVAHATGEYVMFLDGDDLLSANACERAYEAIMCEGVDLLQFDTTLFSEDPIGKETEENLLAYLRSVDRKVETDSPAGLLDRETIGGNVNFTVWNKIYRRALLVTVNEQIPDEYLNISEDILFSYLVQYFAKSFSYLPAALHKYRFGTGISTSSEVSDQKLEANAKSAFVYSYLRDWTEQRGHADRCEEVLSWIGKQIRTNVGVNYFFRADKQQRAAFLKTVQKYMTPDDLVITFGNLAFCMPNFDPPHVPTDRMAQEISGLEMFSARKTEAKTIGTFYFRMYNGGIENVISILTGLWIKSGYRVVLFTDEEPNEDDYAIPAEVTRVVLPRMKEKNYEAMCERVVAFRKALLDYKVDVMLYHAWVTPYVLLDEMIIKSCGVNLMIHTHNLFCCEVNSPDPILAYHYFSLDKLYQLADSVICLTDTDLAWWRALGHRALKTVNPIQLSLRVQPSALGGHRLLFVARISWEKQVLDAIRILRKVRNRIPDATLTIVGKGDDLAYVDKVRSYISEKGLENCVEMAGFHTDMLPFYQNADIMLCTSAFEGFGLALMESKICGLPLVTYELSNLDIMREARGMRVVAQGDVDAAADAVVEILKNDDLKKSLGKEAQQSAENVYGVDLGKQWETLFAQTLLPKPKPSPLSETEPIAMAARLAVDFSTDGLWKRICEREKLIESYRFYEHQYHELLSSFHIASEQRDEYARIVQQNDGVANSASYKLGLFLTAIPRWMKRTLKKLLKRG